ncbi:hypothetical protein ER308_04455 [Egibacter rhizosphaerae]|uniref:PASTA domain-containing protein n=1 Tax=Egibacter rhizosphaerae TaxID=1670831 RepID=A0A411YCF1_9ACTN|nr:hypothetical protein [Egibacter rhizosphaerae]QBI18868.1 hypothetical protein ER308_04455 [Egibacter rhizosphaerae]
MAHFVDPQSERATKYAAGISCHRMIAEHGPTSPLGLLQCGPRRVGQRASGLWSSTSEGFQLAPSAREIPVPDRFGVTLARCQQSDVNRSRACGQLPAELHRDVRELGMDFEEFARGRPDPSPPSPEVRARARATLAAAVERESAAGSRERVSLGGRFVPGWRLAPALAIAAAVAAVVVVGVGPVTFSGDPGSPGDPGNPLGPSSAQAVEAVERDGYTEVRFLEPTADPERIRSELQDLGIDLDVTFVSSDPFSVGRLLMNTTNEIEPIGERGSELEESPIGIRVPEGWSGSGELAIGRPAEDGEAFQTSIPLNADRPGGPLHCNNLRGLSVDAAADQVRDLGLQVQWRTVTDDVSAAEEPPADYVVNHVLWHAPEVIILFAGAQFNGGLSDQATALVTEGCDGTER